MVLRALSGSLRLLFPPLGGLLGGFGGLQVAHGGLFGFLLEALVCFWTSFSPSCCPSPRLSVRQGPPESSWCLFVSMFNSQMDPPSLENLGFTIGKPTFCIHRLFAAENGTESVVGVFSASFCSYIGGLLGGFGGLQVALGGLFGLVLGPLGAIWGSLADRQSLLDVL